MNIFFTGGKYSKYANQLIIVYVIYLKKYT